MKVDFNSHWSWISPLFIDFFFSPFIFISWRLIPLQYCSGFCHTLTWISHRFTCVPHPDPPSHLPLHPIDLFLFQWSLWFLYQEYRCHMQNNLLMSFFLSFFFFSLFIKWCCFKVLFQEIFKTTLDTFSVIPSIG